MKALVVALLVMLPGTAWAGCETPAAGSLPVDLCYDGKCERTEIASYCKGPGELGISFANGWNVSMDADNGKYAGLGDAPRDPAKMTCKAKFDTQQNGDVVSPSCWFLGLD